MKRSTGLVTLLVGLSVAALNPAPSFAQDNTIHRVVTTLDKSNKSSILFDSKVPLKIGGAGEGVASIWVTEKGPADFAWDTDRSAARKGYRGNADRRPGRAPIAPKAKSARSR